MLFLILLIFCVYVAWTSRPLYEAIDISYQFLSLMGPDEKKKKEEEKEVKTKADLKKERKKKIPYSV